jgi:hypothetical protein
MAMARSPQASGGSRTSSATFIFMVVQFLIIVGLVGVKYYDVNVRGMMRKSKGPSEVSLTSRKVRRAAERASASTASTLSYAVEAPEPIDDLFSPACQLALDKQPGHGPPSLLDFSIASSFDSRTRRDAIREGWGKLAVSMGMRVRFFVGTADPGDEHGALSRLAESKKFGDLVVLNMTDGYEALTSKTLGMLTYTAACGNGQYIGKMDEDVFIWVGRLVKRLKRLEADTLHDGLSSKLGVYMGNFWLEMKAIKNEGNKNREVQYMGQTFPPYAAGPCYFLSRAAAEYLGHNSRQLQTKWHNEDMAMGTWLLGADVAYINEPRIFILGWKEHSRPFIAQHATDIAPYATTEEWQLGLAKEFSEDVDYPEPPPKEAKSE